MSNISHPPPSNCPMPDARCLSTGRNAFAHTTQRPSPEAAPIVEGVPLRRLLHIVDAPIPPAIRGTPTLTLAAPSDVRPSTTIVQKRRLVHRHQHAPATYAVCLNAEAMPPADDVGPKRRPSAHAGRVLMTRLRRWADVLSQSRGAHQTRHAGGLQPPWRDGTASNPPISRPLMKRMGRERAAAAASGRHALAAQNVGMERIVTHLMRLIVFPPNFKCVPTRNFFEYRAVTLTLLALGLSRNK